MKHGSWPGVDDTHASNELDTRMFARDLSGNQTGWRYGRDGFRRELQWDEENRLKVITDDGGRTFR